MGAAGTAILILEGTGQATGLAVAEGGGGASGAHGGAAIATAAVTSDGIFAADTATATAQATGGFTSGSMGTATADATAVTDDQQQAIATAKAYGTGAVAQTSAQTQAAGNDLVLAVSASTGNTAFASYNAVMTSGATINGAGEALSAASGVAFSWVTGLPGASVLTPILLPTLAQGAVNPFAAIDQSLSSAHNSDATVLGYGVQGVETGDTTSSATISTSQTFKLGLGALSGDLVLGLVGETFYGAFNNAVLTVTVGGNVVVNQVFHTASDIQTYFSDNLVDLGSYGGQPIPISGLAVTVGLSVTTTPGTIANPYTLSGFGTEFILGSTGTVSPPVIGVTSPAAVLGVGQATPIGGISVSEAGRTAGDTFTVTVSDTHGVLSVQTPTGSDGTIAGQGSTALKIVGSLAQVDAALAALTDTAASTAADTIVVNASDTNGGSATPADIGVTVNGVPVITTPVYAVRLAVDQPTQIQGYNSTYAAIIGMGVTETGTTTAGETFTVTVTDSSGTLAAGTPVAGVTYTAVSASELRIEGTYAEVNNALAALTAQNLAPGTITVTASDSFNNSAAQKSFSFSVLDTPAQVEALTRAQINQLAADGVTDIPASGGMVNLTIQQAGWLAAAGIKITGYSGVTLSDTAAHIESSLTTALILQLPVLGVTSIVANDGPVTLTVDQVLRIEAENQIPGVALSVQSSPSPSSVTLSAPINEINALSVPVLSALGSIGVTGISASAVAGVSANVIWSVAQANALAGGYPVPQVAAPAGGTLEISDTAAAIQALQPTDYQSGLNRIGIGAIVASSGSLVLTVAQMQAIINLGAYVSVSAGATVTIADTAANIQTLLDAGSGPVGWIEQRTGFVSLNATDGPVALTAAEAETLETVNAASGAPPITVVAPAGLTVTLTDTAADIEAMLPSQLAGLTALGITGVTVTDTGLTLTVAQALALYDPLPISVPPGTTVVVADTEAAIDSFTPAEITGLAALGVVQIDASGLTGAQPLTIDAGMTLAVGDAVPAAETISFAGTGGTLALGDTTSFAGTIDGFSATDAIDLTDAVYDPAASVSLDPASNILTVTEVSGTYSLQLDPAQIFLTTPVFVAVPDAGTGTEITYTRAPVDFSTLVSGGQTVNGAVILDGGAVEVASGGTANRLAIENLGYVLADAGSTITDAVIGNGGTLELAAGAATGGAITFGPVSGGTLIVDDTNLPAATITNFGVGDVIDLNGISYDPAGSTSILSGNTLQIIESGNTYDLQLDPSQDFLSQSFTLTADASGNGTDITEVQAPVEASATIIPLQYVNGAVVASGGAVEIQPAGALDGATASAGGLITVAAGGRLINGLINGGVVDAASGGLLGQAIDFGGNGGTLQAVGSLLPTATIYGFGGNDTIDLTNVAYQFGAYAYTDSGNHLLFAENSTPYSLNIDPSQQFFGFFSLSQDAGTGTDITLIQQPIDYTAALASNRTAAGLVIQTDAGGQGNFYNYGGVVNATINVGGALYVESGGTIGDAVINSGGTLDLQSAIDISGPIGFGTVGGTLEIDGLPLPAVTITGMAAGDAVDLTAVAYDASGSAVLAGGNQLQITESGQTYDLQLDPAQDFTGKSFSLASDAGGGTTLTADAVPCFLAGTLIRTARGEIAVEDLRTGDTVTTLDGRQRRLTWIGNGRALTTRGRRTAATPIIVRKSALSDNVPHHDLRITKGHSLYLDGVLIPAEFLVNHRSILWDDRAQEVTVYHLELETHDVLLANGAAAESYRDDGNRWLFRNANMCWDQPAKPPCAPVLTGGPVVDAVWRRLLERSGPRKRIPMTDDPDLHLMVDGRRLDATERAGDAMVFTLPGQPGAVRIVSRSVVPQELGFARDPRCLGVAMRRLVVRRGSRFRIAEADNSMLVQGFHSFEPDNRFIWTDGDAALPMALLEGFAGPVEIVLIVGGTSHYIEECDRQTAAAAA